ncbi:hypothetical protein IFR04_015421 [Cadophora malorum]|uniref:Uncharacterized protein n=1 Tax=Cadophora malorum TaxID=108018 RepID=A0A8H7T1U2_9HELO|nr:hypothetical protein IFR04_015421 [Cadophora malorum]
MSSYPSSTCATDGSNNSFPRYVGSILTNEQVENPASASNITTPTRHDAFKSAEEIARMALFLNDNVETNSTYQRTSSASKMAPRSDQMRLYLESFDNIMEDKK